MSMKVLPLVLFALSLSLAVLPDTASCGWGVEVGRGTLADLNDLAHAEQSLWNSQEAIARVNIETLKKERQRQLLGLPPDPALDPVALFWGTFG
jgi:hypothetical protein